MSLRGSTTPWYCSGGAKPSVPIIVPLRAALNSRAIPKSTSTDAPFRVEHHVGRLHVAVDYRRHQPVQVDQHVAQLARDIDHQPLGQRLAARRELLFEVAPLDVLHHQVMAIGELEAVGDRGNCLMLQLRERVGFAREIFVGLDPLRLVDKVIDHLFDRAGPIREALIVREIHHPHPAAAEQPLDLVARLQQRAGLERSGLLRR